MKLRKMLGAICALAVTASAFAGFGVTADAAAGDVTVNAEADFTSDMGDFTVVSSDSASPLELSSGYDGWLAVGKGSGTVTIPDEELAGATDKVTVEFKVAYGKLINRSLYYTISDSNGTVIVDWDFNAYSGEINTNVLGSGSDLPASSEFYYAYNTPITARAASYKFEFDFAARTVKQTTVNMQNNATTTHTNNLPDGVNNVKTLTIGSNYENAGRRCVVDDIKISTTEGENVEMHKVTVNYLVGGEAIPAEDLPQGAMTSITVADGTEYTPSYADEFFTDTELYTFASSDISFPVTINSDTTINLTYTKRALETYDVTVNSVINDVKEPIVETTLTEKHSTEYAVPKYIVKDGIAYVTAAQLGNGEDAPYYKATISDITEDFVKDLTYTKAFENVVAFAEGSGHSGDNADIRCSGGSGTRGTIEVGNVEPSIYAIEANSYQRGNDTWIYLDGEAVKQLTVHDDSFAVETTVFEITKPGKLTVGPGTNSSDIVDYILLYEPYIELMSTEAQAQTLTNQQITPADGGDAITVSGTAYTIWYKLTGFDEGTQPTITLKGGTGAVNETATITRAEVGTDGYYCVQILDDENLEAGSYKVTLTAGDATSEAVTFTAE